MNKPIAALLLAFLSSCDRSQETPGSGSLPGIALHVAARRSVVAPETLRVVVRIDGLEALDHRQALSSSRSVELEIPHGSLVRILARIHAGGDTTETGDTSFVMPATPQLGILLHLSAVLSGGAAFSRDPRTRAVKGVAFHDTLLLTEPGSDSADRAENGIAATRNPKASTIAGAHLPSC